MREIISLLRSEPRAATFFAALTQSALGTGAGYVALLLIAYDRLESAWAVSLVLAADLVPAMLLGPVFGAVADRFSRRATLVTADILRAIAFIGITQVDGLAATVALAGLAGVGTGLFNPAALASLTSLVGRPRLPAATALFGAVADLGFTVGPALGALVLVLGSAEDVLLVNGATFAVSALVLGLLAFGERVGAGRDSASRFAPTLLRDAREGIRATRALKGVRTVLFASSVALFFVGAFNVAELLFAKDELGAGEAEFAVLVAGFGLGFMGGSVAGASGGSLAMLKRRFLGGLALVGLGFLALGVTSSTLAALGALAVAGFGNGLLVVYERLLLQAIVPDALAGRVFGMKDSLSAWAFAVAFFAAGVLIEAAGVRTAVLLAGAGGLLAWGWAALMLRGTWTESRLRGEAPTAEPVSVTPLARG
jgi:MFS family permease